MKKLIVLVLATLPLIISAHQDRYFTFKYNNVTVRFKTGHLFEELNNAKIIGEYAALLSDSMNYSKPILLDFIHDYGYTYRGNTFSFLNIGSEKYDLVSYYKQDTIEENLFHIVSSDSIATVKNIVKEVYSVPQVNKKRSIVIRQFGSHFNLEETLNLLYYALTNKAVIKEMSRPDTLASYLSNMYYSFESIPCNIIDSIKSETTTFTKNILINKVYRETDTIDVNRLYYSYFSQNGQFHIFASIHEKEIVLDTLDQVYSFDAKENNLSEILFVFEAPYKMRTYSRINFLENQFEKSKKHQIDLEHNEFLTNIGIEWLGNDVYLINYSRRFGIISIKKMLYLSTNDVLIKDFDDYLNSYRKNKK